jgi:hypothetical protein
LRAAFNTSLLWPRKRKKRRLDIARPSFFDRRVKGNPIIFLDFDGVLNNQLFYVNTKGTRTVDLDPENVKRLNEIISATQSRVVVTSTWRLGRTVHELQSILESVGFEGEVIDKTKDLRRGEDGDSILRGNEIHAWMKSNPAVLGCSYWDYNRYVILDDDSDMLYWQRDNFLCIDPYVGLTPKSVFLAKRILGVDTKPF